MEPPHNCPKGPLPENISIRVVYANMRSINPTNTTAKFNAKIAALGNLIKEYQPVVVAIVETWLKVEHENEDVAKKLQLEGYTIWRHDRGTGDPPGTIYPASTTGKEKCRGGGILLACKPVTLPGGYVIEFVKNPIEDMADNILTADIQLSCSKCNKDKDGTKRAFAMTVVYRPPRGDHDETDWNVRNRLTHMIAFYNDHLSEYSGWSFVGDFNFTDGGQDDNFQDLAVFAPKDSVVLPEPQTATHQRGGCLDLVVASPGHVNGVHVTPDPISDHCALIYNLNLCKMNENPQ